MLADPGALFLILLAFLQLVQGALVTRTIDSRYGDSETGEMPVYVPSRWTDENCPDCMLKPDKSQAFRGTWAETTYVPATGPVSITFRFIGAHQPSSSA